jgi:hypothetical protein
MDKPLILSLDSHGVPHRWISWQQACFYYAKNLVAWTLGDETFTYYGGISRITGERSSITAHSIVAIKGKALAAKGFNQVPPLNNRELFRRDRHMCAYCGGEFSYFRLTRDHITPLSRGGRDTWMNVVCAGTATATRETACRRSAGSSFFMRRTCRTRPSTSFSPTAASWRTRWSSSSSTSRPTRGWFSPLRNRYRETQVSPYPFLKSVEIHAGFLA